MNALDISKPKQQEAVFYDALQDDVNKTWILEKPPPEFIEKLEIESVSITQQIPYTKSIKHKKYSIMEWRKTKQWK